MQPIRCLLLLFLILSIATHAAGQTANLGSRQGFDGDSWERLAKRAELVVETAAASDAALGVLRADLVATVVRASETQERLAGRIDRLNAQLAALGEREGGAVESPVVAARRAEISDQLDDFTDPFLISAEAIRRAESLISRIDEITEERRRKNFYTRGASPLNPSNLAATAEFLSTYTDSIAGDLSDAWTMDARQGELLGSLPASFVLAALGITLLLGGGSTLLGAAYHKFFRRHGKIPPIPSGLERLFGSFLFPLAGVTTLASAVQMLGIWSFNGSALISAVPGAAAVFFGARWIGLTLFSKDGSELVQARLGEEWSGSMKRLAGLAGSVLSLKILADSCLHSVDSISGIAAVIGFPISVLAAPILFRLGGRLSRHFSAVTADHQQTTIDETAFSVLMILAQVVAVVAPLISAIGYGIAGDYLLYPPLYTLALLGAYVSLKSLLGETILAIVRSTGVELSSAGNALTRIIVDIVLAIAALPLLAGIWGSTWTEISGFWQSAREGILLGGQRFTIGDGLALVLVFAGGCLVTALLQSFLKQTLLPNAVASPGARRAIVTGSGYAGVALSGILAVSIAGVDLTNIAIVAGALSVGIGFGLQTVVSNFVSGVILLVERPINVGDWVVAGGVSGTVKQISVRSTKIETFDRAVVVVPNSDLIANQVTNWTLGNRLGRLVLPVGVAYGTDARRVEGILIDLALQHEAVMDDPRPIVIFQRFGPDALEFELRVILSDVNFLLSARSDLNFMIEKRFAEEGISIPFPQRDIWIRNADELRNLDWPRDEGQADK